MFTLTALSAVLVSAIYSTAPTQLPAWKDVRTTGINAETCRTEIVCFPTREDAITKSITESDNYLDLNGVWDFRYFDSHKDMEASDPTEGPWDKIKVPGNWEVQGFGIPIYVNIPYDFAPVNPQPPQLPDTVPAAIYHRTFSVPEKWKGRVVFLNLDGIKSGSYIYVNGNEAGYCEDSKNLARFDITPYLNEGDNDLVIKVYRYTAASYLECQDFWRISGIERDVYLSSQTHDTGFDFRVVSSLDEDLTTGVFRLDVKAEFPTSIEYELIDKNGETVLEGGFEFEGKASSLEGKVPDVRKWSAETPELYTLLLKVNGEYTTFHVGFRRLEIKDIEDKGRTVKAFLVNGKPVKFKGVNYHEHSAYTGHYVDEELLIRDLKLMKEANINAIRTCHYPQQRRFYELCDIYGFYVYDEANIESHGMGYALDRTLANNPDWYEKHLDRTLNMYYRTANYPCVTILSLGNEAGNGINFYNTYSALKELEKDGMNRPVCYERAEYEWNTDMIVPMYPSARWFHNFGETQTERPAVPCEYTHAMGNSNGSLDLQWNEIYSYAQLQGAFIWDWADQGLADNDKVWAYGGDYGENMPSDNNFNCNGIVAPDRDPHPGYFEVKHCYQNISVTPEDPANGVFKVENRYYFTSLEGITLNWTLERDGKSIRKGKVGLSAAPQESETIRIKLPSLRKPGEYRITFQAKSDGSIPLIDKGFALSIDQIAIKDDAVKKPLGVVPATVNETEKTITLQGKKASVVFDKEEGIIKQITYNGVTDIDPDFGLRPLFWRAPIDNDYGCGWPEKAKAWKEASEKYETSVEASDGVIRVVYALPEGCSMDVLYSLCSDVLRVSAKFKGSQTGVTWIPRIGFRFRIASDDFSYFGMGPVENYQDRFTGAVKSIFKSTATDEYYPYVRPQETGHHIDTEWLAIGGVTILGEPSFEFNALRQSVEDLGGNNLHKTQTHISDVPFNPWTEVCIDFEHTGVGGYNSWGATPEKERTVWSDRDYSGAFSMVPAGLMKARKAIGYN